MKTIIMYVLKGVLFLVAMVAMCVLFGEPSDDVAVADVVVMKVLSVGVIVGVVLCWFRTMGKREYNDMMNEEV